MKEPSHLATEKEPQGGEKFHASETVNGVTIDVSWSEKDGFYWLSFLGTKIPPLGIAEDVEKVKKVFAFAKLKVLDGYSSDEKLWNTIFDYMLDLVASGYEQKKFHASETINGIIIDVSWAEETGTYKMSFLGTELPFIMMNGDAESAKKVFAFTKLKLSEGYSSVEQLWELVLDYTLDLENEDDFGGDSDGDNLEEKYVPPNGENLPPEVASNPELKAKAEAIIAEANKLREETLKKVTERLGSNEGGWYENTQTGERFYIKLYKDPDMARTEFLANAIYKRLGIKAAESQLLEMDGRLAVASKSILDAEPTYQEDQRNSADVRGGFVADAYLANWDVVGLAFDNIVRDKNGSFVRIDNGGSLTFRAQGGTKEFSSFEIPELTNMLNPAYTAGKVFEGLSEDEMRQQAQVIVDRLKPKKIESLVREAGFEKELAEQLKTALIGRRETLMKRFGLTEEKPSGDRIGKVLDRFESSEEGAKLGLRPRDAILGDSGHIENQQIDFIDAADIGCMVASFKLTSADYEEIAARMLAAEKKNEIKTEKITYKSRGAGAEDFEVCDAWVLEHGDFTIKICRPAALKRKKRLMISYDAQYSEEDIEILSATGLVNIRIPVQGNKKPEPRELEEKISAVFEEIFGIDDCMTPPSKEAEDEYKAARYAWHHKLSNNPSEKSVPGAEHLVRKEVLPRYFTMVDEGKSREYQEKFGDYAVIHSVQNIGSIPAILRAGLLSSHERFKRGLLLHGMSSTGDFQCGGADSAFTRILPKAAVEQYYGSSHDYSFGIALVFRPGILDRTDWYAYGHDEYGSTAPDDWQKRLSPEELFKNLTSNYTSDNEQMFRAGIAPTEIIGIVCPNNRNRLKISLDRLAANLNLSISGEAMEKAMFEGPQAVKSLFVGAGIDLGAKSRYHSWMTAGEELEDVFGFDDRMRILFLLEKEGIAEINGKPISEAVVWGGTNNDLIEIANGRPVK